MEYQSRIDRAQAEMAQRGCDVLLLSAGLDMPYLTGYTVTPFERLTMFVLRTEGVPVLVVPALEAPLVDRSDDLFELRPWDEAEDPTAIVAGLVGTPERAGIGDETWATFLLQLQHHLPATQFVSATPVTRELRMRKAPEELARLRGAGAAVDRIVGMLRETTFGGHKESDIATHLAEMLLQEGHAEASFTIIASGPNSASPHHHPGDRVIIDGDSIVIDFGGPYEGYFSDTSRSFHVGEPSSEVQDAFDVLFAAQADAVNAVRPGVTCESIDQVARKVIDDAGYGEFFIHRTGHGIGLSVHEEPYIVRGNDIVLEASMTFSVEPGIYVLGRFGMRIEDIVAVTADGVENFNNSDHTLAIVG